MDDPSIRIAVLHFSHETVTFLKNDTTLDDFIYPGSPARGEALLKYDVRSYMGGFVKMAREFNRPFLGTVRLDKLPYENVDLKQYYPYGNPAFPG